VTLRRREYARRHATDVRMEFKRITEKAGVGRDWSPRELRHTATGFAAIALGPLFDSTGKSGREKSNGGQS
jgi:hypothetical protein